MISNLQLSKSFRLSSSIIAKSKSLRHFSVKAAEIPEKVILPTNESNENLIKIRHSSAHVLGMAVQKLFPDVKLATGPWTESG